MNSQVRKLQFRQNRVINIQNNVIKIEVVNPELKSVVWCLDDSVRVESFNSGGHPRALLKSKY